MLPRKGSARLQTCHFDKNGHFQPRQGKHVVDDAHAYKNITCIHTKKKEAKSGCFLFVLFLSALNNVLRQKFKFSPVYHYVVTALRNNFTNFILSQKVRLRNVTTCNFAIGCHANRTTQCPSRQAPCSRQCRRAAKPYCRRLQQLRRQPRATALCACDRAQARRHSR